MNTDEEEKNANTSVSRAHEGGLHKEPVDLILGFVMSSKYKYQYHNFLFPPNTNMNTKTIENTNTNVARNQEGGFHHHCD